MMRYLTILALLLFVSCAEQVKEQEKEIEEIVEKTAEEILAEKNKASEQLAAELKEKGFQVFDYVDEETGEVTVMQQYFMAFLKRGPNRSQNKAETDSLQRLHMAHLGAMYKQGYADISGPFGDDGDIRGITIYNVPTFEIADSLANMDPMVKAGRLVIEIHPWWAAKGFPLR